MEMKITPFNGHNIGLDAAKSFACVAVVVLHLIGRDSSPVNGCLFFFSGVAVPIFFMANGYFVMNKRELCYRYIASKTGAVLSVVVLWVALLWVPLCLKDRALLNPLDTLLGALFGLGGWLSWFWFFGGLLLVWLMAPLAWRVSVAPLKARVALAASALAICVAFHCWDLVQAVGGGEGVLAVPEALRVWTWLTYFLWGGVLGCSEFRKRIKIMLSAKCLFVTVGVLTLLLLVWQYGVGYSILGVKWVEHYYDDPTTFLLSVSLLIWFDLFLPDKLGDWFGGAAASEFAKCSMGIYIVHPFLWQALAHVYGFDSPVLNALAVVLVVLVSFMVVAAMKRVRFLKRMVTL